VRLQLHALAYNLGNFLRTLATPEPIKDWSLTSLKEKLIKIGAKVVRGRYWRYGIRVPGRPMKILVAFRITRRNEGGYPMKMLALLSASLTAMLVALLLAAPAQAQSETTFVSSTGTPGGPCTRAAPCNSFFFAHDATVPEGEIRCLDSGPFGGATIDRSITIDCPGATTNQFIVSGTGIVVRLRNLTFNGLLLPITTGISIDFVNGSALFVENCIIANNDGSDPAIGIRFQPSVGVTGTLYVSDTVISNNGHPASGGGIFIQPAASGSARVLLDRVRVENNTHGIQASGPGGNGTVIVQVRDSVIAGSAGNGVWATTTTGLAAFVVDRSSIVSNAGSGILVDGANALVHLGNSTVFGNGVGLNAVSGGKILSYQSNQATGNFTDGAPTGVLSVK
jgi:hypothetical protein